MIPKLLATDIDGTITDSQGRIHLKAIETIRRLEERNIPVILVSGRPLPMVESLAMFIGTSGPLIAENGGILKINGEIIRMGNPQPAKEALHLLLKSFHLELDEDNRYRMVDVSIKKTIDPGLIQDFLNQHRLPVSLLVTNVMLHLVDEEVSKGLTLEKALSSIGFSPKDTAVSGDSYNDLPSFGIGALNLAVGNAEPALKEQANLVATAPYGEGFAELVKKVFLN